MSNEESQSPISAFIRNIYKPIAGMESKANKVTSLSDQSTDTQYPSAKCVYDVIGNIETLLAAI